MPRCPTSGVPEEVRAAFAEAKRVLGKNLDSWCLEASAVMLRSLEQRGHSAVALRRVLSKTGGGHWTVRYKGVEYDPTISMWKKPPRDAQRGCLYVVSKRSPHKRWRTQATTRSARVKRALLESACLV